MMPELMLIRYLRKEIIGINKPIQVKKDNSSTIKIAEGAYRERMRLIIMKAKSVEEAIEQMKIELSFVAGD